MRRQNMLSTLPHQVALLSNLEELDIQENKFSVTAESIPGMGLMGMIKFFQACAMSQFTKRITLNVMGMTDIPKDVLHYTMLTSISLMGNKLAHIPDAFGENLKNLKKITFRSNQLTTMPNSFGKLANSCESLDLSYNAFGAFPAAVCELKNVTFLDLSYNRLKSISEAIGSMLALEHLRLDNNELKSLAASLSRLPVLSTLNIRYNEISDLKGVLNSATALTNLDLRNNRLTKVPPEIGRYVQSVYASVYDCLHASCDCRLLSYFGNA
jgi:Leucine-rich repeat (LRR) protein